MGNSNTLSAEIWVVNEGKDQILINFGNILWLSKGREGVRSPRGVLPWRKCLGAMHAFATSKNESTLEVAPAALWNKENYNEYYVIHSNNENKAFILVFVI